MRAWLAVLLLLSIAAPAQVDVVRRCVDARGVSVYTDRPCDSLGADTVQAPTGPAATMGATGAIGGFAVRGCARTPDQLLYGVRGALEARDVNRLANWYHWPGTGSGAARSLMDELEALANRPLVAVELRYPPPRDVFADGFSASPYAPHTRGYGNAAPGYGGSPREGYDDGRGGYGDGRGGGAEYQDRYGDARDGGSSRERYDDGRRSHADTNDGFVDNASTAADTRFDDAGRPQDDSARFADRRAAETFGDTAPPGSPPRPAGPPPPRPTSLHVEQMQGPADITARSTDFRLVRHAACWWISY